MLFLGSEGMIALRFFLNEQGIDDAVTLMEAEKPLNRKSPVLLPQYLLVADTPRGMAILEALKKSCLNGINSGCGTPTNIQGILLNLTMPDVVVQPKKPHGLQITGSPYTLHVLMYAFSKNGVDCTPRREEPQSPQGNPVAGIDINNPERAASILEKLGMVSEASIRELRELAGLNPAVPVGTARP